MYGRVSIQMQQVEMHFNDWSLGTCFSLQQIKNWQGFILTLKLLTLRVFMQDFKSSGTFSEYSLHIMIAYFTSKVGSSN